MSADSATAGDLSFGFTIASQSRGAASQAATFGAADEVSVAEPAAVEAIMAADLLAANDNANDDGDSVSDDVWSAGDEDLDDILVAIGGDVCGASGDKKRSTWDSV